MAATDPRPPARDPRGPSRPVARAARDDDWDDGLGSVDDVALTVEQLRALAAVALIIVGVVGLVILAWQWHRPAGIAALCVTFIGAGLVLAWTPDRDGDTRGGGR